MGREDKTHQSPDEEYMPEFTGEGAGADLDAEKAKGPQFRPEELSDSEPGLHPTLRKIFGIIALILGIILVAWFLRHQEKQKLAAQTAETPVVTEIPAKAMVAGTPEVVPSNAVVVQPVPTPPVAIEVPTNPPVNPPVNVNAPNTQAMQVIGQENTSKVNDLSVQVRSLADSVTRISQNVQTLETKVTGMSSHNTSVTVLPPATTKHKVVGVVETVPVAVVPVILERPVITPFVVTGIIPRRAWIDGPYGSSFTVTVGDIIPRVGKVISINVRAGEVVTSGGNIVYEDTF